MQRLSITVPGGSPGTGKHTPADPEHATLDQTCYSEATLASSRVVHDVADLIAIFEPHVNVQVLRRPLSDGLADDARKAVCEQRFRERAMIRPDTCGRSELRSLLPGFPHLADDAYFWTDVLAELTGCEFVGVRLERLDKAMCPRFHVDKVTLRIVRTFGGPGTEYLVNADVDRRWLGAAAHGLADEESGLLRSPGCVRAAATGDVVLLKGEAWPDNADRGAVHRSPHASPSAPRLVMTLDSIDWAT
ncbi:MAG: DUF1826 domain-containing protein [Proteobacteria bacterium]|nr:DUF1826 domain-containing protein [Pseudomonadota bacterium]